VSERTATYRLYNGDDVLLYVGASKMPEQRYKYHAKWKRWWPEVKRRDERWHPDRDTALRDEAQAIAHENPLYNASIPLADGSLRGSTTRTDLPEVARNASPPLPSDMRSFRAPDEWWLPFVARAKLESRSASDAMTDALRRYALDESPSSYDLTFANWPQAATWLEPEATYNAFAAMDSEISDALAWPRSSTEYLTVATWHAVKGHPGDPKQQARVITGHLLRKVLPELSWAGRYRDTRHLTETLIAILSRHLPLPTEGQ